MKILKIYWDVIFYAILYKIVIDSLLAIKLMHFTFTMVKPLSSFSMLNIFIDKAIVLLDRK